MAMIYISVYLCINIEPPWWLRGKKIHLQCRRHEFDPWVRKIPWRRKWQPIPVLLPGESHGGRSLGGYSPWGCEESDTTERLHFTSRKLSNENQNLDEGPLPTVLTHSKESLKMRKDTRTPPGQSTHRSLEIPSTKSLGQVQALFPHNDN